MDIVAGTFASQSEARSALHDLETHGISPVHMNLIKPDDRKGFAREHRPTSAALKTGAVVGVVFGVGIFGFLLLIAGASPLMLRYMALYVSGIAMFTAGGAAISALWNIGVSHDEALLYEEAKETNAVIAAVEVDEPFEELVVHTFQEHGARTVRTGNWPPKGWKFNHPTYETAA
jgi:hypothetical protein